jgi:hypothetical protein
MSNRKGSLLALRDRDPAPAVQAEIQPKPITAPAPANSFSSVLAPSRQGKKAMTGYFTPEMSFAMHMTARKNGMSLQDSMAEAFNDWLRKMGESPVGK